MHDDPLGGWGQAQQRRVLIVALNYAPDLVGAAKYTTELAQGLAQRGHQVEVVTGPPYYPEWRVKPGYNGAFWRAERIGGVRVWRTPLYVGKSRGASRLTHLASFGAAARLTAGAVAQALRPHLAMAVAPTLTAAQAALSVAKDCGAASWLHVQDMEIDAAFGLNLLGGERLRRLALDWERGLLTRFDHVSTLCPAMAARLQAKGVAESRLSELRNWADLDAIRPGPRDTRIRRALGLGPERVVALYSGTMGVKQGLDQLAKAAERLETTAPQVSLVFAGEGPGRGVLQAACEKRTNVFFLPLQPAERLDELLASADLHLLPQRAEAQDLVLPSKLSGMLASGRPVVAMAAPASGLAQELEGCGRIVAASGEAMAAAVVRLAAAPEERRRLGLAARAAAERCWSMRAVIDGFERDMLAITARTRQAQAWQPELA